jgi:alkylated DNA nucleotide flippase Atl1
MRRRQDTRQGSGVRVASILSNVASIPRGFVCAYSDIDHRAPRLVGLVLARVGEEVPWQRVVHADGTAPMGPSQLALLRIEGVPMRGERVDMARARYDVVRRRPASRSSEGCGAAVSNGAGRRRTSRETM